jgi:hypothetical protein
MQPETDSLITFVIVVKKYLNGQIIAPLYKTNFIKI